ncbi:MAG: serine hydrolase domain-containing protein [Sphingomonas sp.]|uniref:serine hydrolase domain-containing protein n=1 Tax=Sphingomonas sp. TaxID=28214 RepID=UPI003F81B17E
MTQTSPDRASPALQEYLNRLMEERSIPGLQIAVVLDGRIEALDAIGLANIENHVPVSDTSVFSINSMAKAFTGIAVMQLVEAGKLDLAAPISTYLDDLPEDWRPTTVRQLAMLTSGLPEMMVYTREMNVSLVGDGSEESAWSTVYAMPREFPADQGFNYTQTNYALLGRIITKVSGKPFTRFITEGQLDAAGMTDTQYATDSDILPNRANTYMCVTTDGDATDRVWNSHLDWPPVLHTAAGLHSTARDLAQWVIALQSGKLLADRASIETMLSPWPLYDGRPGVWGIGWLIGLSAFGRVPAPGGGAKAQVVLYPDGLSVIVLTNLLGAFREHVVAASSGDVDVSFADPIAKLFTP